MRTKNLSFPQQNGDNKTMSASLNTRLLITGPAGTGKTTHCIQRFAEVMNEISDTDREMQAYFVLPSKEHADRIQTMLLRQTQSDGYCGNRILTLSDLIRLKATRKPGRLISGMERGWIVASILKNNHWSWWEATKTRSGLISAVADWLAEVRSSGVSGRLIRKHLLETTVNQRRTRKYQDLLKLLELYEYKILNDGLADSEELMLNFIQEQAEQETQLDIDLLIVDGFYRFTALQEQFLEAVSKGTRQTIVTLTNDGGSESDVFQLPRKTRHFFLQSGFSEKIFSRKEGFRFHSNGIFEFETYIAQQNKRPESPLEGVSHFEAESMLGEADQITDIILEDVKKQQSFYSDHMIVVRNIRNYRHILENIMIQKNIPVFIHERKKLIDDPVIRFIVDWHALVKEVDEVWKINTRFLEALCARQDQLGEKEYQYVREVLLETTEWEDVDKVRQFFDGFEQEWFQLFLDSITLRLASANANEFKQLILTTALQLQTFGKELKQTSVSVDMFLKQFTIENAVKIERYNMSFEEALLRLVSDLEAGLYSEKSEEKNQVQIYDVVLSLPKEYKNVYVLGLSDGIFPPENRENVIFDDYDRGHIFPNGEVLTSKDYLYGEQYFFYMVVSRAKNQLILSRPKRDDAEKILTASIFYEYISGINHVLDKKMPSEGNGALNRFALAIQQREEQLIFESTGLLQLLGKYWVIKANNFLSRLQRLTGASLGTSRHAMDLMRDVTRSFSPTELAALNDCSYKHYAEYVLRLRSDDSNVYLEEGNFLHRCMEEWVNEECFKLSVEESKERVNHIFDRNFPQLNIPFRSHYEKNESSHKLRKWVLNTVESELNKMSKRQDCFPIGAEISFGKKHGKEVVLEVDGHAIQLHGKIDRVDVSKSGGYTTVVDYKRGEVPSRAKLIKGQDPQTPVYLTAGAVISGYPTIGIEYVSFSKPKSYAFIHPDSATLISTGKGEKDYELLLEDAQRVIGKNVMRLRDACIEASPTHEQACRNCVHMGSCRFKNWKYYQ